MKDLSELIERIEEVADLPPGVKSLPADELLRLHDNLGAAEFAAKTAAAALKKHIRELKVPISRAELLRTAYHEAGHVVGQLVYQHRFRAVSLSAYHFESHALGTVSSGPIRGALERRLFDWQMEYTEEVPSPSEKVRLRQEAISLLAGPEAERRFCGEHTSDLELETNLSLDRLWDMLSYQPGSSDVTKALKLSWAMNLVSTPTGGLRKDFPRYCPEELEDEHYNDGTPIVSVCAFLLRLSARQIRFLNSLAVETRQLVDTHWDQIERIVQALVETKRLTYGQCLRLFNHRPARGPGAASKPTATAGPFQGPTESKPRSKP